MRRNVLWLIIAVALLSIIYLPFAMMTTTVMQEFATAPTMLTPVPVASPVPVAPTQKSARPEIETLKQPIELVLDSRMCEGLQPPKLNLPTEPIPTLKIKVSVMGYSGPDSFIGITRGEDVNSPPPPFVVEYYVAPELMKPWIIQAEDPKIVAFPPETLVCLRWYAIKKGSGTVFTPISMPSITGIKVPLRPK